MTDAYIIFRLGIRPKKTAVLLADINIFLPPLKQKVCIVAKIYVLACNATVDLEHAVAVEAKGRANCVRHARISATYRVFAGD